MNKTTKILLVLVLVGGVAYYFINRGGWSTMKGDRKDFAIADTASITRFFFADRKGGKVLIEKNDKGVWMVNGRYKADLEKVKIVLATMHDMQVRNPIAENEFNAVVAFLASDGIKAEFYAKDKLIKTIYVGPSSPDQTGTFMLVEGSSTPYVTHIPGFVGYLTPRFITEPVKWRSKEVFDDDAQQIRWVSVVYPGHDKESFRIENRVPVTLLSVPDGKPVPASNQYLRYYLGSFRQLYFEGFEESVAGAEADSLRQTTPFCIVTIGRADGSEGRLQVHLKPVDKRTKQQMDEKGNKLPYDTEKYFAFVNGEPETVVIQDFTFDKILKRMSDFVNAPGSTSP